MEFWLTVRMTAYFILDENETLVCERIYSDRLTVMRQLIGGLNLKRPSNSILAGPLPARPA